MFSLRVHGRAESLRQIPHVGSKWSLWVDLSCFQGPGVLPCCIFKMKAKLASTYPANNVRLCLSPIVNRRLVRSQWGLVESTCMLEAVTCVDWVADSCISTRKLLEAESVFSTSAIPEEISRQSSMTHDLKHLPLSLRTVYPDGKLHAARELVGGVTHFHQDLQCDELLSP